MTKLFRLPALTGWARLTGTGARLTRLYGVPALSQPLSRRHASTEAHNMYCYQCEQTQDGIACTEVGVCGKSPDVAKLQDLIVHSLKSLSSYAVLCRAMGEMPSPEVNDYTLEALFSTLTNVNFDAERMVEYVKGTLKHRDALKAKYEAACQAKGQQQQTPPLGNFMVSGDTVEELVGQGTAVGVESRQQELGMSVAGVQEMAVYGMKGLAAYAHHAHKLGSDQTESVAFVHKALDSMTRPGLNDLGAALNLALEVGKQNVGVMQALHTVHRARLGVPEVRSVRTSPVEGKAILVSGHDMCDLEGVLKAAEGTGVNVYTHGEMLPAHSYPGLNKYKSLAGHFGGPWQLQRFEFGKFPGAILMTSNCLVEPRKTYRHRIFTAGPVGFQDVPHISNNDYTPVVELALDLPGFKANQKEDNPLLVGYGLESILGVADKVIGAIEAKELNHIFYIGGCDGSETERNYFTQLAQATPSDSVILTAGCGKYRLNRLDLGSLGDLPRVMDMGQCNDSYGTVMVALALADHFKTDINGLPLSLAVSWFEQKAVVILLSLLHLGVQNIRIGPNLPGFVTPEVLDVLADNFKLKLVNVNDVEGDLKAMMANC